MNRKLLALIATLLAGCASAPPSPVELANADYGPFPKNYQSLIVAHMKAVLKDPDSARFGFVQAPVKSWYPLNRKSFGWAVCVGVNAKNSYGGYTGTQPSYFLIKNGEIIQAEHGRQAEIVNLCPIRT